MGEGVLPGLRQTKITDLGSHVFVQQNVLRFLRPTSSELKLAKTKAAIQVGVEKEDWRHTRSRWMILERWMKFMPCAIRSAMLVFCRRLSFVSLACSSSCKLPPCNHHAVFENLRPERTTEI